MAEVKRYNIRMAGIGGQGVVTASHIVSNGVVISGGFSSLVPFFGSEKRNAPVESYVRISNETIYEIGEIIYPNVLLIFHPSVITLGKSYTMPFYTGLKQEGIILINSKKPIPFTRDEQRELEEKEARIYYLPATEMANELAKTDLATNGSSVCQTWSPWLHRLKTGSLEKVSWYRVVRKLWTVPLRKNLRRSKNYWKPIKGYWMRRTPTALNKAGLKLNNLLKPPRNV